MRKKTIIPLVAALAMALAGCGGNNAGTGDASQMNVVILQAEGEYIIDGTVFNDVDGDSIMDTCEPGIEGALVRLLTFEDVLLDSTTTNNTGQYAFAVTAAGNYRVMEIAPAGYFPVADLEDVEIVQDSVTVNFAEETTDPSYSICGTVYEDIDGSETMDEGESGMAGVTVTLSDGGNTVTSAVGVYAFAVTTTTSYTVSVIEPEGYMSTTPNPVDVLISDSNVLQDFGLRSYVDISMDVKPCSEVNPVNLRSRGVLPVAILGSEDFDVTQIDPVTVSINDAYPLRWNVGHVCGDEECEDEAFVEDDHPDLLLKFETQEIAAALMTLYPDLSRGDIVTLDVEGELTDQTALMANPPVRILVVQVPK